MTSGDADRRKHDPAGSERTRLLFVTWDGPQVNYLETLFAPIFSGLRGFGIDTSVLQFCLDFNGEASAGAQACRDAGLGYRGVRVDSAFGAPGALIAAVRGAGAVRAAVNDFGADVLMPRGHPALSVLAAGVSRLPPICFDADGLQTDERAEFRGLRRHGPTFAALKAIETGIIRRSRSILVRSEFAKEYLAAQTGIDAGRFHIVRNGRDPKVFAPGTTQRRLAMRQSLGFADDAPLLVYVGTAGPQYRFDLISKAALAVKSRRKDARLLILSGNADEARQLLDPTVLAMTNIQSVAGADVPRWIAIADLGLSFRARTLSMQAVSPVKLGEYLLCGVPVLGTSGIGDTGPVEEAGLLRDESAIPRAADWLMEQILPNRAEFRKKARVVGIQEFSLERSVRDYLLALRTFQHKSSKGANG